MQVLDIAGKLIRAFKNETNPVLIVGGKTIEIEAIASIELPDLPGDITALTTDLCMSCRRAPGRQVHAGRSADGVMTIIGIMDLGSGHAEGHALHFDPKEVSAVFYKVNLT